MPDPPEQLSLAIFRAGEQSVWFNYHNYNMSSDKNDPEVRILEEYHGQCERD